MTTQTNHSRHKADHYTNCQSCYEDHLDFLDECRIEAQYDLQESEVDDDY